MTSQPSSPPCVDPCAAGVDAVRRTAIKNFPGRFAPPLGREADGPPLSDGWLTSPRWLDHDRRASSTSTDASRRLIISPFLNERGIHHLLAGWRVHHRLESRILRRPGREGRHSDARRVECQPSRARRRARRPSQPTTMRTSASAGRSVASTPRSWPSTEATLPISSSVRPMPRAPDGNRTPSSRGDHRHWADRANPILADVDGGFSRTLLPYRGEPPSEAGGDNPSDSSIAALADIASATFMAYATEEGKDRWTVTVESTQQLASGYPGEATLNARLLTAERPVDVPSGEALHGTWQALEPEAVTPFVALELRAGSPSQPIVASCVVLATLHGGPTSSRSDDRQVRRIDRSVRPLLVALLQLAQGDEIDQSAFDLLVRAPTVHRSYAWQSGLLEAFRSH